MQPQMNTDEHRAAEPQPKNLTAETQRTRRSSLGAHASSVPWVSDTLHAGCVRSQEPADENPWRLAKDFRKLSSTDLCSSVVPFRRPDLIGPPRSGTDPVRQARAPVE